MIQIDIDMPKSCFECDKTYKWKEDGEVQCPHINMPSISSNMNCRPPYCPLMENDRPKGHWIEHEFEDVYYECSECGEAFCLMDKTPIENMYNFCPNCGADMKEEKR